jgi:hypothetical protein
MVLPVNGYAEIFPVPQDESDSFVVVGQADITRKIDAGVGQRGDHGDVHACKKKRGNAGEENGATRIQIKTKI